MWASASTWLRPATFRRRGPRSPFGLVAERHVLGAQDGLGCPGHRVIGEVPLNRTVVQCVVQRRHDHRLVEHKDPVADRAGRRVTASKNPYPYAV